MRRLSIPVFFGLLAVWVTPHAHAQFDSSTAPPPDEAVAKEEAATKEANAKLHFELGAQAYQEGAWEQALAEFKQAYDLSERPALLYNLYLCHERLAHWPEAADNLEAYLARVSDIPNRDTLLVRLRNLRARIGAEDQNTGSASPDAKTEPNARQSESSAVLEAPRSDDGGLLWTWVALGGTVALAGAGALFAGLAGAEHTTLEDKCSSQGCTQADIDASSGPGLQTAGQILFGVAGAAAVATVILFFVESDSAEETLVAGPSGVGMRF